MGHSARVTVRLVYFRLIPKLFQVFFGQQKQANIFASYVSILFVDVALRVNHAVNEPSRELVNLSSNAALKIFVHKDDSLWLGKHLLSMDQLEIALIELGRTHSTETPELYCDEKASFGTYQRIKNALETAGFTKLDVILKRE